MTEFAVLDSVLAALARLPADAAADAARGDQDRRWAGGERVPAEAYLAALPAVAADPEQALVLIYGEVLARTARGESPAASEYQSRFPQWADRLALQFQIHSALGKAALNHSNGFGSDPDATRETGEDTHASNLTGPFAPHDAAADPIPTADGGRYRLGAELARGGMGVVYRGEDLHLRREVAVKVLTDRLKGTDAARRFAAEAEITAGLQHPGIPPVHALGTLSDDRPFLAMKLIHGQTLAKRLAALKPPTIRGKSSSDEEEDAFGGADRVAMLAVFEQICLAVAFAHSRRVIHRDLKPGNVMVGMFGEVQVMDWGLAKRLGQPDELGESTPSAKEAADDWTGADERTRSGQVMGTPSFMPPEQARGELYRVDERADVFALGGILCVILTGRPPYTGRDGREVWRKAAAAELGGALAALAAVQGMTLYKRIAVRCLDADPAKRYSHAGEVAAAVHHARTTAERARRRDEVYEATEAADRTEKRERWRRLWWQSVGLIGIPCGILGVVALWLSGGFSGPPESDSGRVKVVYFPRDREPTSAAVKTAPSTSFRDGYLRAILLLTADEVDSGTFRKGGDARRRSDAEKPVRLLIGSVIKRDQAFGYVVLAALADAADNTREADGDWSRAVDAAPVSWDMSKTAALCLDVIREFAKHPRTALSRLVIKRVGAALERESKTDHGEKQQVEIAAALAKAEKMLTVE